MKKYMCVKVNHHEDVGKTIEEWQKNGWSLHTYCPIQIGMGSDANHYLLFERKD